MVRYRTREYSRMPRVLRPMVPWWRGNRRSTAARHPRRTPDSAEAAELNARTQTHRAPRSPGAISPECRYGFANRNPQHSYTTGVDRDFGKHTSSGKAPEPTSSFPGSRPVELGRRSLLESSTPTPPGRAVKRDGRCLMGRNWPPLLLVHRYTCSALVEG